MSKKITAIILALAALLSPVLFVYFVTDFSTARSAAGMTAMIVPE